MTVMTRINEYNTTESVLKAFAKSKAVKTLVKRFAQSSMDFVSQFDNNMHIFLSQGSNSYGKNVVEMTIIKNDYFGNCEFKIKFVFQYNLFGMTLADISYDGTISNEQMDETIKFVKGQLWETF